jgi:hypothetical protein
MTYYINMFLIIIYLEHDMFTYYVIVLVMAKKVKIRKQVDNLLCYI